MVGIKNREGADDGVISKGNFSQPLQLGSYISSHSKRILNDVIVTINRFENNKIYYGDTDSIHTHNDDYEILKTKKLMGKELYQSKNDHGKGGISRIEA